jgi:hypothetical protein
MFRKIQSQEDTRLGRAIFAIGLVTAGLASIFLYPFSGLLALGGLTLGCYVLAKSKRNSSAYGAASAKWIIVSSVISLFLFVAIAAPSVLTTHSAMNETSAVSSMLSISGAQREFVKISSGRYGELSELAETTLIDSDLASGSKKGYRFYLRLSTNGFEAFAIPVSYGRFFGTGQRSFYLNERGNLHEGDQKGGEFHPLRMSWLTERKGIVRDDSKIGNSRRG